MKFQDHYELALESVAGGDVTPMMLFPIGIFKSAKYPELPLTRELADQVIANFEAGVLGTEPVVDTSGNHDTSAPAGAWVKRVYVAPTKDGGEAAFADVKWTDVGARKISDREYQYNSVELGPVVDNLTGLRTENVLRSVTLTNTPVIRLLPPILEAGDSMAEPVDVALSEVEEAHTLTEDDGNPAETSDGSSEPVSHHAKGDEGQPAKLDEGDAAQKGSDLMKTVALKLNLAEDADEGLILAEVVKLTDERDAAVAKIAAVEKAARDAEVEHLLSELVDGAHILPGQKEAWKKLADDAPDSFTVFAENAKKTKAIELGESGDGANVEESDDPNIALAELATKIASERKLELGTAMDAALAERPDLAARLYPI